ncbi:MAG: metalloregulator ArsR/SmtB family transcription factor [Oscillospiraceae bacterium]
MSHSEYTCSVAETHDGAIKRALENMPAQGVTDTVAGFFKVLGDGTRVRILRALESGELCVCDIAEALGMTKSAVSHQLSTLRTARLVAARRDGKTVFYSLADAHVKNMIEAGLEHVHE